VPNLVFVGAGLYSVIYRYKHTLDFEKRQAMRGYVWGISLLIVVHFINLLVTDVYYWIAGQPLFQTTRAGLTYVLTNEPIWFACEVFFAVSLAYSVFRKRLFERE
jgi:hypothetical protein